MNTLLTYYIGMSRRRPEFWDYVTKEACLVAGGCTVNSAEGHWVVGAHETQEMYHGCTERELSMQIEIVVPADDANRVRQHMKYAIIYAATEYDVDIDWVHVTSQIVNTHHFSIAEDAQ